MAGKLPFVGLEEWRQVGHHARKGIRRYLLKPQFRDDIGNSAGEPGPVRKFRVSTKRTNLRQLMNGSVRDGFYAQGAKWDRPLRSQRWLCKCRRKLPKGHPVMAKRRALSLSNGACEFIGCAEGRSDDQDLFRRCTSLEPLPAARDAVMTGGGADDRNVHFEQLTNSFTRRQSPVDPH
jgi:hypothetical protein